MRPQDQDLAERIEAAPKWVRACASVVVGMALLLVLSLGVFAALVCALLTHAVYSRLLRAFRRRLPGRAATVATVLLTLVVLALLAAAVWQATTVLSSPGGVPRLLDLLADALERVRGNLPGWLAERVPASADDFTHVAVAWLRAHAHSLQQWGQAALRGTAHVLAGLMVGFLAAFEGKPRAASPWGRAAAAALRNVQQAFRRVVSAQLRIAVVNALLTTAYLFLVLPLAGVHLPVSGTLVVVTLITGMLPIVGNLLSNAAIVLASLMAGPGVAVASIVFLVAIHKTEYFLNAHFVGRSTRVPSFCILAGMVGLEAWFGLSGLIAAPIYCAWVFLELQETGVIAREAPH